MTVHTPIESRDSGIPAWAIGITVFVLLVGGVYLASNLSGENPAFAVPGSTPLAPAHNASRHQAASLGAAMSIDA